MGVGAIVECATLGYPFVGGNDGTFFGPRMRELHSLGGYGVTSLIRNTHPPRITIGP